MQLKTPYAPSLTVFRVLVGLPFVAAGTFSALSWSATVQFNAILTGPGLAAPATAAAVFLNVIGGLSILFGIRVRMGALCILLFLVPASARHLMAAREATELAAALEARQGPPEIVEPLHNLARRGQLASFVKNVGLTGVALFIILGGLGDGRRTENGREPRRGLP